MPGRGTKQICRSKGNYANYGPPDGVVQVGVSAVADASLQAKAKETDGIHSFIGESNSGYKSDETTSRVQHAETSNTLARANRFAIEKIMAGDECGVCKRAFEEGFFFSLTNWQNDVNSFCRIHIASYYFPAWINAAFVVRAETSAAKENST